MDIPASTIKLLLVDDEQEFLESTARALSRRGFTVRTATEGNRALSLLRVEAFDAVVLDVKMPGPDGMAVFDRIARRDPQLPVIILTGHGTVQQAFEASRNGVFDYLTKPCDVTQLAALVRKAVDQRQGAQGGSDPIALSAPVSVLFVDDELDFLKSVTLALQRRGLKVTTATSAAEAIEELDRQAFDVAVVDLRMPGTDGIGLLRRLRDLRPLTAVILLSGQPTLDKMVEAFEEQAFAFLTKPQTIEALVGKILEAHARRESRVEEIQSSRVRTVLDEYPD